MNEETHEMLKRAVKTASESVAYFWPSVVTADDLEQELWTRLMESPGATEGLKGESFTGVVRYLKKAAQQIASKERDDYELFTGNYKYSGVDVVRLLEDGGLNNLTRGQHLVNDSDPNKDYVQSQAASSDGDTVPDRIDLHEAFLRMGMKNENYARVIWTKHMLEETLTTNTEKSRYRRAIQALTQEMNRSFVRRYNEYEGPGSRKIMSNSKARFVTNHQWEDAK